MDIPASSLALQLQEAVDAAELGLWDLRAEQETVHYPPQWKARLGFPDPRSPDSTHFWRCRVHPDDLGAMLAAIRVHARGREPTYECTFRLRSNGSGYRQVHSRGRVIERGGDGRAMRMIGTMVDLTPRPCTPSGGVPPGPRGAMAGLAVALPFHVLVGGDAAGTEWERGRVLGLVDDLLRATLAQLADRRVAAP